MESWYHHVCGENLPSDSLTILPVLWLLWWTPVVVVASQAIPPPIAVLNVSDRDNNGWNEQLYTGSGHHWGRWSSRKYKIIEHKALIDELLSADRGGRVPEEVWQKDKRMIKINFLQVGAQAQKPSKVGLMRSNGRKGNVCRRFRILSLSPT